MTVRQTVVSALLVWHLVAITFASLPTTAQVARSASATNPASTSVVVSALDRTGRDVSGAAFGLRELAAPVLSWPVARYLSLLNLAQLWSMFSNPPTFDRYWRVRYYIQDGTGRQWMATELIGPAHIENRIRLLQSFRDSYTDKAMEIAFDSFLKRRKPSLIAPGTRPDDLPDDLAPFARYFARRFERTRLAGSGDRIARTEVWIGTAPNKAPESPIDTQRLAERQAALQEYWQGPVEDRLIVPAYPPYHGAEQQADIVWLLEYFEE